MTGALVMYSTSHAPSFNLERKNWPTATLGASGEADPSERITDDPRRILARVPAPMHWSGSEVSSNDLLITTWTAVPTVVGSAADCGTGVMVTIANAATRDNSLFTALILPFVVGDHNRNSLVE